jgi:hypothetical protein
MKAIYFEIISGSCGSRHSRILVMLQAGPVSERNPAHAGSEGGKRGRVMDTDRVNLETIRWRGELKAK